MNGVAFGGDRQLPVTQVAYHSLLEGDDTSEADPHPAPGRHQDAGPLTDIQDGGRTVAFGLLFLAERS